MKPTTSLFEVDLVFSQQQPLTPTQFIHEFKRRELRTDSQLSCWDQLKALHRAKALIPMYRLVKNVKPILDECRRQGIPTLAALVQNLSDQAALGNYLHGRDNGEKLCDPRGEPFKPWSNYVRKIDDHLLWTSTFLYSPYQLLLVPMLRSLAPKLRVRRAPRKYSAFNLSYRLDLREKAREWVGEKVAENDELVIVLTALEAVYRPWIIGRATNHRGRSLDVVIENRQSFDPVFMLNWIGWDAERIRATAERLLIVAESLDPLNDWYELVRLCTPGKWQKLRGDALVAMDHRIAAEMLLRFYEDLEAAGAAPPLEPVSKKFFDPRRRRLKADPQELDRVLMDFGISPQPSLILVLEGETEELLVPRAMDLLGIPRHRSFIQIFTGQGVDTNFGLLASYISVPELGEPVGGGHLLNRPPTHFLVAVDAEKCFIDAKGCEEERVKWATRIFEKVPLEYRTPKLKEDVLSLVSAETWDGQSFEFAHFTDEEIARGILDSYQGSAPRPLPEIQQCVCNIRRKPGNVKSAWESWAKPPIRKTHLAETLWPILKRKIEDAMLRGDISTVPIARVLERAYNLAADLPRRNVSIRK